MLENDILMETKMQAATIELFLPNGEAGADGAEDRCQRTEVGGRKSVDGFFFAFFRG